MLRDVTGTGYALKMERAGSCTPGGAYAQAAPQKAGC